MGVARELQWVPVRPPPTMAKIPRKFAQLAALTCIRDVKSESESLIWSSLRLRALSVSSRLLWNFVAVYLTFVQFIVQIKLCLYTTVHLVHEFKNFSQVILKYTTIISGVTKVGVTQGGNWLCHPILFLKKVTTF